jgi:ATP-binding cassette subfamily B protein
VEGTAFSRAWRYLGYKPLAKWTAWTASVVTGILFLGLLCVLALFTDLLVSRGRIPSFRDLPAREQQAFQASWQRPIEDAADDGERAVVTEQRKEQLAKLGIGDEAATVLAGADFAALSPQDRELVWRSNVYRILENRVGPGAAALTLPEYGSLTPTAQSRFQRTWNDLSRGQRLDRLENLDDEIKEELTAADVTTMPREKRDVIWRAHVYGSMTDSSVGRTFWRDRAERPEQDVTDAPELADRGLLSLIVRADSWPLARFYNPLLGVLADWNPWTWRTHTASVPNYVFYLTWLLIVAVILAMLRSLAMHLLHYSAAVATIEASNRLRRAVYHHTYRLGTLAFRALGPSEAVGIFARQIEAVHDGLYTWLTVVIREPVRFTLVLLFALALNTRLTIAFLLIAILVWAISGQIAVAFRRRERDANQEASNQLGLLQESLMMMRLVKCYLMELFNQARVERQLTEYSDAQMLRSRGRAIYRPVLILIGTTAALILLYVAGWNILAGQLGVARAITLATALISLYWPLSRWLEHRRFMRRSGQAAATLFKFLDRPGEVGQVVGAEFLPPLNNKLEFINVRLREPGTGRALLQDVTLTIEAGQRVAIVGPEEMEKHALVYLIPRFLDPSGGEIRIDGKNLRWVTLDSLRAQVGVVLQHNLVFNDTVGHNIGCGDPGYTLPRIIEAAKIAHAHQFIQKLPKGYQTPIGEQGHYLNAGEMFRIALARAILRDPALFIIEEPAVQLDEETKDLLSDTFDRVFAGRTVIFLPHRSSTIRSCDRVFLLNNGQVEAAGDHREMLTQSELYRHLQYLEFNVFAEQPVAPRGS